jgi:hypothetical protein
VTTTTSTTVDPNRVIDHAVKHGLLSVWPRLLVLGILVLGLMVYIEFKRQSRKRA